MRVAFVTTTLAAAALLAPATAHADVAAALSGSTLAVDGSAGRDEVEISAVNGELRITNTQGLGRTIDAGFGCRRVSDTVVGCPRSVVARARVLLGGSDDTFLVRGTAGDLRSEVHGGDGGDSIVGSNAGDSLFGDDGRDILSGGAGDDALNGGAAADSLAGGSDDDSLDGGEDDDQLDGGLGVDTADYSSRGHRLHVDLDNEADDGRALYTPIPNSDQEILAAQPEKDNVRTTVENITGGAERDQLFGNDLNNRINGLGGDDHLRGDAGNDHIIGSTGADFMSPGTGYDLVDYSDHTGGVVVGEGGGGNAIDGEGDVFEGFFDRLLGGPGDDTLGVARFSEPAALVEGGPGDDILHNDLAVGLPSASVFSGGPGTDTVSYRGTSEAVVASLDGVANDGRLSEGDEIRPDVENLIGGSGEDELTGSSGPNVIDGRFSSDRISGLGGDDRLIGGLASDRLLGGPGLDVVSYETEREPVKVSLDGVVNDGVEGEFDTLAEIEGAIGGDKNDELIGDAGANRLAGGPGLDRVVGGAGDDRIFTVDGEADRVFCGEGADSAQLDLPDVPDPTADCEISFRAPRNEHPIVRIAAVTRAGGVLRVRLHCPRGAKARACRGTLRARRAGRLIATDRFRLRLGRGAVLSLGRARPGAHVVETSGTDRRGRPLTTTRRLTLR